MGLLHLVSASESKYYFIFLRYFFFRSTVTPTYESTRIHRSDTLSNVSDFITVLYVKEQTVKLNPISYSIESQENPERLTHFRSSLGSCFLRECSSIHCVFLTFIVVYIGRIRGSEVVVLIDCNPIVG